MNGHEDRVRRTALRDSEIVSLAQGGMPPREIARRFPGLRNEFISIVLAKARAAGITIPRFRAGGDGADVVHVSIATRDLDGLRSDAEARDISPEALARRLIAAIARDDLVDAVLDDVGRAA